MKTLKISLDFLAGPLWKDEFIDGELRTGIPAKHPRFQPCPLGQKPSVYFTWNKRMPVPIFIGTGISNQRFIGAFIVV